MTEEILQQTFNWLTLGSIYAVLAIGFSLLFGVLNVIHFSHGDVSLLAPFVALGILQALLASLPGLNGTGALLIALALSVLAVGGFGILLDKTIIRPFRDAPPMMGLVATVALGIVLRELIRHLFPQGSNPHAFPAPLSGHAFSISGVPVTWFMLVDLAVTASLIMALIHFFKNTPLGIRTLAVSQDREAARLMGIDPNHIFRVTFFIASATGAIAGLLYASHIGVTRFDFGILAGLMGFSAAVIGGLGSIAGAILGGLLLAGLETVVQATVPSGTAYRQVFAFLLVVLVLVFRPAGLLGKPVVQKV